MLFPKWSAMNARNALRTAYEIIATEYSVQVIDIRAECKKLPYWTGASIVKGVMSVIADDSDHHRQRRGLMIYPSVALLRFPQNILWIIGFGHKGGSYPGDAYGYDLFATRYRAGESRAFPITFKPLEFQEFFKWLGDTNDWFESSLITVMSDGRMRIRNETLKDLIAETESTYVISSVERKAINFDRVERSLGHAHMYRRDFPRYLARTILEYLEKESSEVVARRVARS